ncbi:hypothetical protein MPSEU_001093500 [Mayamaea pseudoterrestris]|nr:hypothetical protein MPSEU_001093500 [Mayamaea pseudoterrestris]
MALYKPSYYVFLVFILESFTAATKHNVHINNGPSLIGPVGPPFGFLQGGVYELTINDFVLTFPTKQSTPVDAGFYLQRFPNEAAFYRYMEQLRANQTICSFELFRNDRSDDTFVDDTFDEQQQEITSAANGIILHAMEPTETLASLSFAPKSIRYQFKKGEEGLYFLLYQVCSYDLDLADNVQSTFRVDFQYVNYDSYGEPSFLTAGEMRLPLVFFLFAVSYLVCAIVWLLHLRDVKQQHVLSVYKVHYIMTALVFTKFITTFVESLRYHGIRLYGHAEGWTVIYYLLNTARSIFLFVVILLLGTGWSIVKPFLNKNEKQVVTGVLVLQVVTQVALIALEHEALGEVSYARWTAILHLVDILCCCAVLLPIVWQVNKLEKTMGDESDDLIGINYSDQEVATEPDREAALQDGDKGEILEKLHLFRSFYLLVVAYIYATRILVYLFISMLSYKYLWVRYFVVELVTLTFYVSAGMMFRPTSENSYASVKRDEEEEGDDNYGMHAAVEMRSRTSKS